MESTLKTKFYFYCIFFSGFTVIFLLYIFIKFDNHYSSIKTKVLIEKNESSKIKGLSDEHGEKNIKNEALAVMDNSVAHGDSSSVIIYTENNESAYIHSFTGYWLVDFVFLLMTIIFWFLFSHIFLYKFPPDSIQKAISILDRARNHS